MSRHVVHCGAWPCSPPAASHWPCGRTDRNLHPVDAQVVQAATKWKRMALRQFGMQVGEGLCTDMRAVRKDYFLDHDHSCQQVMARLFAWLTARELSAPGIVDSPLAAKPEIEVTLRNVSKLHLRAYQEAIDREYRFFSYGEALLII